MMIPARKMPCRRAQNPTTEARSAAARTAAEPRHGGVGRKHAPADGTDEQGDRWYHRGEGHAPSDRQTAGHGFEAMNRSRNDESTQELRA